MPCYESRDNHTTVVRYESGISPDELKKANDRAAYMEAVVCALMNEIDRRGIAEQVIAEASRNGLINIMDVWVKHKSDDRSRLASDLHRRYSKDEQAILLQLLTST